MLTVLPQPHEAQQLCRLRALRVQRARAACAEARQRVDAALQVVREGERRILRIRTETDALVQAICGAFAPQLPRWGTMAGAQRERLADQLERAECGLVDDQQDLEAAREQLARARAELTRAQAAEDAVRDLATQAGRARRAAQAMRADTEIEDQGARRAPGHGSRR